VPVFQGYITITGAARYFKHFFSLFFILAQSRNFPSEEKFLFPCVHLLFQPRIREYPPVFAQRGPEGIKKECAAEA